MFNNRLIFTFLSSLLLVLFLVPFTSTAAQSCKDKDKDGYFWFIGRADDVIKIGMVDLQDNDRWIELGQSRAWNWQQGCMLQWRPGSQTEIMWNDRQGENFVCNILDVRTRKKRTVPFAIYSVSPDGNTAVAPIRVGTEIETRQHKRQYFLKRPRK